MLNQEELDMFYEIRSYFLDKTFKGRDNEIKQAETMVDYCDQILDVLEE